MQTKISLSPRLASDFVEIVAEEALPFNVTVGRAYILDNDNRITDLLVEHEDQALLAETIDTVVNHSIV